MELFENWKETKDVLLEGLPERKKAIMAPLLENQKQYIMETADAVASSAGAIANFQKIMIPMIRRIIPGTIATELVGTQPMSGPVGLAYSLRFLFSEAVTGTDGRPAAVPPLYNDSVNIAAGDEVYGVNNSKLRRYYSSANVGTAGYPPALTAATSDGLASTTANYEAFGGRAMRLEVLKQTVTAGSRKLQAKWTVEAAQDLNAQHGLDLEAEITAALSAEIVTEIDQEVIRDLEALAGTVETFDFATVGAPAYTPTFVGDRFAALGVLINKVANNIARKTRRGAANWMVVSPLVVSALQSATKSVFAPAVAGTFDSPTGTKLVGTLNGSIKVYSYVYWDLPAAAAPGDLQDPIIMGYKGGTGEMDTGYFYCPYIPLMSSNVLIDPQTYNPQVSLMTRYGKATFTNTGTSLGNSADYYGRIVVSNLAFL